MAYILILNPTTRASYIATDFHDFIITFSNYEDAKAHGDLYKENEDCREYQVYGLCTEKRNHII